MSECTADTESVFRADNGDLMVFGNDSTGAPSIFYVDMAEENPQPQQLLVAGVPSINVNTKIVVPHPTESEQYLLAWEGPDAFSLDRHMPFNRVSATVDLSSYRKLPVVVPAVTFLIRYAGENYAVIRDWRLINNAGWRVLTALGSIDLMGGTLHLHPSNDLRETGGKGDKMFGFMHDGHQFQVIHDIFGGGVKSATVDGRPYSLDSLDQFTFTYYTVDGEPVLIVKVSDQA